MEALMLTAIVIGGSIIGAVIGITFNLIVDKIADARGYGDRFKTLCHFGMILAASVTMFLYFNK